MSKQESRLSIAIESQEAVRNAKAVTKELEFIQAGGEKASKSVETFGKTASSAGTSVKGFGSHIESSTKALSDQINTVDKNVLALKTLAKHIAGIITINSAISRADAYTQMAARIEQTTKSTAEYNMVQKRLLETANTTYRSLSEAQEAYLAIESSIKLMGKTTKQALDISDAMSFAFTANATATDKAKSAMDAYGKSLDMGKVGSDQWISIMQAIPGIAADIAASTGRTEAEIRTLGVTGKITVE
jgi:tape measure domain-containing protein